MWVCSTFNNIIFMAEYIVAEFIVSSGINNIFNCAERVYGP